MDDLAAAEEAIRRYVENGNLYSAMHLYRDRLGEFRRLGWQLAEYRLGLRLTEHMVQAGGVTLEDMFSMRPWYDRTLYNLALGNLELAEGQLNLLEADLEQERAEVAEMERAVRSNDVDYDWAEHYEDLCSKRPALAILGRMSTAAIDVLYLPAIYENLSDLMLARGKLTEAERFAQQAIDAYAHASRSRFMYAATGSSPFARRAAARFLLGNVEEAQSDLDEADRQSPVPRDSGGTQRVYRLQFLIRQGKLHTSASLLALTDLAAVREECPLLWAGYSLCQAEIHLAKSDVDAARPIVQQVTEWAACTGHQETWIRAMLATARLQMRHGVILDARPLLEAVQRVTRDKGFTIWLIECLILKGHRCLQIENLIGSEEAAQEALLLSDDSVTGYAWGAASASHLLAEIRLHQNSTAEARDFAQRACSIRASLGDARIYNSRAILDKITAA